MKKIIYFLLTTISISNSSFGQDYEGKIIEIQSEIDTLEEKKKNYDGQQSEAIDSKILALEQEKKNLIKSIKTKNKATEQQREDITNAQKREKHELNKIQENNLSLQEGYAIRQLQNQQMEINQKLSNELNSISNSMQNIMIAEVRKNLLDRQNLISGFYNKNQTKLNKIITVYNQIPKDNFKKNLNGLFKCFYTSQKKFIYANNYEIICVEDCIVKIENNVIENIYLYGNKEMELDLPLKNQYDSKIYNGVVTYIDIENLETFRIIILEPYLTVKVNENQLIENKVGYITLWSKNKDEEGKIVYLQELSADKKQLIREVSVKINYAKNEKELLNNIDKYSKVKVNVGNIINYLGEITSTPYGNFPLHTKTNSSALDPLNSNESRLVEIKKYRD